MLSGWRLFDSQRMLTGPLGKWSLLALVLFAVGVSLLILPTYAGYCDAASNQDQYRCAPYEITSSILSILGAHNALISAIATVFIGYFTYTLKQSTEKMWIETKKAADAADLSAQAAVIVEFPIIRTAWIGPELLAVDSLPADGAAYAGEVNDGFPTQFSVVSTIEYRNYGRSPAFPIGMLLGHSIVDQLPIIPNHRKRAEASPSSILKERDKSEIEIHYGIELTEEERSKIANKTAKLWFFIRMTYLDIMDRPYFIGSCWQWGKQTEEGILYFFDDGTAPAAYTKRGPEKIEKNGAD